MIEVLEPHDIPQGFNRIPRPINPQPTNLTLDLPMPLATAAFLRPPSICGPLVPTYRPLADKRYGVFVWNLPLKEFKKVVVSVPGYLGMVVL